MSPYHGSSDEIKNKCSSRKFSLTRGSNEFDGKLSIISVRMGEFFLLGVVKSRSYSSRMIIHQENFTLI
jgi:hypothetical protein